MKGEPFAQLLKKEVKKAEVSLKDYFAAAGLTSGSRHRYSNLISSGSRFTEEEYKALVKCYPVLKKVAKPTFVNPEMSARASKAARKRAKSATKKPAAKAETKFRKARLKGKPKTPQRHRDRLVRVVNAAIAVRSDERMKKAALDLIYAAKDTGASLDDIEGWLIG